MPDFRIYYDGGSTYDGAPENAPAFGVLVIVQVDKEHGRELVQGKDYFVWKDNKWYTVDFVGMVDYLQTPGWKRVLFGRMVNQDEWYKVCRKANEDPDLPPRTARREWEVE